MRHLCWLALAAAAQAQSRDEILAAMKQAATFYTQQLSREGGFHFTYAANGSGGRSEHARGASQVETQRDGTPRAGLALLEAWEATRDPFYLEAARRTALALVRGQLCSGGWDYVIEFDPAQRAAYPYRVNGDCAKAPAKPATTLDDNVTQGCLRLLMRVDRELKFGDPAIHEAALFALASIVKAQYANGAWPQRFTGAAKADEHAPPKASYPEAWPREWPGAKYQAMYTLNDNALSDVIDALLEAARIYGDTSYRAAAVKAGGFILNAQMPEPQPGWAQQYDAQMHPAWARAFEPPSVTGGETQSIVRTLFVLYRETGERQFLDAAGPALAWLERSVIPRPAIAGEAWARVRAGDAALARFYELRTNRPLYLTKERKLSYSGASVITHYSLLVSASKLPELRREYEARRGKPPTPRPERLHGLSPWDDPVPPLTRRPPPQRVRELIAGVSATGAWQEQGVWRTRTFAVNLETLAAALKN